MHRGRDIRAIALEHYWFSRRKAGELRLRARKAKSWPVRHDQTLTLRYLYLEIVKFAGMMTIHGHA
jgi:hypothetical protein